MTEFPEEHDLLYEMRYQKVYAAGAEFWSTSAVESDLDRFAELLRPGARGLELGCGEGRNAAYLATKGFGIDALDVAPSAIARAQASWAGPRFFWADAVRGTGLPEARFDFVFSVGCLHMLVSQGHRDRFLAHARALTQDGGFLLLVNKGNGERDLRSDPETFLTPRERQISTGLVTLPELPRFERGWTEHVEEIERAGFKVLERIVTRNEEIGECMRVIARALPQL